MSKPNWDDRLARASNAAWNASYKFIGAQWANNPSIARIAFQGLAAVLHELAHDEPATPPSAPSSSAKTPTETA